MSAQPATAAAAGYTILCVDDEPNILNALRRLLRSPDCRVLTAESGAGGLEILARESVDLVISDMRMPQMDGARFLERVRAGWPQAARMLLTGYADIESTVAAINRGEVSRYIQKPWNDAEMTLAVRQALERRHLEREKARLEALARRQNEELRSLNAGLEEAVARRTRELREALDSVAAANEQLRGAFLTSVKVFANVVELREGEDAGRSRRVADLAMRIARKRSLGAEESQALMLAALLHEIGKVGLPDALCAKALGRMTGEELAAWRRQAITGANVLTPLSSLHPAARVIRALHENFDGSGGPDRLQGLSIPESSRILAVASDYDLAVQGRLTGRPLSRAEAVALIEGRAGGRYDPRVVAVLQAVLDEQAPDRRPAEIMVSTAQLVPGMVLARDLVGPRGLLLLSADHALDESLIRQVRDYERNECGARLLIHVRGP